MELPPLSQSELNRYSRHLLLPQINMRGQQKLKASSVLIVGLGGLGSPVALYLAAAGVGKIGLVDYDKVELSNLQRQVIHDVQHEGELKAVSAAKRLSDLNPEIEVNPLPVLFNSDNARKISEGYDIIVDGTDNIPTRYLVNDLAVLTHRLYVYGSIFRFEGQVSVFGAENGACYRCLFPEPPPPDAIPSCSTAGVMGVLPGIIGSIQAAETIKLITGIGNPLVGRLLLFDVLDMSMETVKIRKRPTCPICGDKPTINELIDYEAWCHSTIFDETGISRTEWDVEPEVLVQLLEANPKPTLLDVREDFERDISKLAGSVNIPLLDLEDHLDQLPIGKDVVVFCRNGIRSLTAAEILRKAGYKNVYNLRGGINAWADRVDRKLVQY
jgi:molybdopterin/thiamine biosynthesis adenylyltransferase/rhodanese-related sulfurtransferase